MPQLIENPLLANKLSQIVERLKFWDWDLADAKLRVEIAIVAVAASACSSHLGV